MFITLTPAGSRDLQRELEIHWRRGELRSQLDSTAFSLLLTFFESLLLLLF